MASYIERRKFLATLGGAAAAWPFAARAQQPAAIPLAAGTDEGKAPGAIEAIKNAVDAYIYGYPLVTFDMIRKQQTNVAAPDAEHAPMGQMIKMRTYPAVDNHCCAAPNADTLYTEVWLDVSNEPWVFSIPDMSDRYYIMPMLDGWSEVFEVASSRTTGGHSQIYAITGPGWSGALPQGVTQLSERGLGINRGPRLHTNPDSNTDQVRAGHQPQVCQGARAAGPGSNCSPRHCAGRGHKQWTSSYGGQFSDRRDGGDPMPARRGRNTRTRGRISSR